MAEQFSTLSIEFLEESIKRKFSKPGGKDNETIGLELELFPFKTGKDSYGEVVDIINERLQGTYDLLYENSLCRCSMFDPDQKLDIPRLNSAAGGIVTFEPGGQIEYSTSVGKELGKTINETIVHMSELENILTAKQIFFFFGGLNPWQSVETVGLKMRKPRYMAMDRYFSNIGPYGQQMMRLSGSVQVSLDFGEPEIAEKRWLATNLISPVFTALFGNSPFVAGKATGYKSYRTIIWQNLDKSRAGIPCLQPVGTSGGSMTKEYLQFALKANVFTLPDQTGCMGYCDGFVSFEDWLNNGYNGYFPTIEDWEVHLTTLFPDVRPKGFMECRFIDGQAKPTWAIPAIVATALIYDETATEKTIELLKGNIENLEEMKLEAATKGLAAFPELCEELFQIALNIHQYSISSELLEYCERFYKHFTKQSLNPADELLAINQGAIFTTDQYKAYEHRLFDIVQPPSFLAAKDPKDLARDCKC